MTKHKSNIFHFDKQATEFVYRETDNKFHSDKIELYCLPKINQLVIRQLIDIGIDFKKPWEEIEMDHYYQIEYLFIGRLVSKEENYVLDEQIGINVFEEKMFGKTEFGSDEVLNMTLIIDK